MRFLKRSPTERMQFVGHLGGLNLGLGWFGHGWKQEPIRTARGRQLLRRGKDFISDVRSFDPNAPPDQPLGGIRFERRNLAAERGSSRL